MEYESSTIRTSIGITAVIDSQVPGEMRAMQIHFVTIRISQIAGVEVQGSREKNPPFLIEVFVQLKYYLKEERRGKHSLFFMIASAYFRRKQKCICSYLNLNGFVRAIK